jgi:hypothetical protein
VYRCRHLLVGANVQVPITELTSFLSFIGHVILLIC